MLPSPNFVRRQRAGSTLVSGRHLVPRSDVSQRHQGARFVPLAIATFVAVFGFLPLTNWLAGGLSAPWYSAFRAEWISGSAIVCGGAIVLAILSQRIPPLWRQGRVVPLVRWSGEHPGAFGVVVSLVAFLLYSIVAIRVFSRVPVSVDELVQLIQARTFASGRLWQPASSTPEFHSILNMVDANGRSYAQFPAGGPAMLMVGVLIGAPWVIGPVCGAIAVTAFWSYARAVECDLSVAVGATALFAFAPFAVFMSGSHMNHVPTLMWLVIGVACMARVMTSSAPAPHLAFVNGLALGMAATIRPVDALAYALPAGAWYLARAVRDPARWRDAFASAAGIAVPLTALLWVNFRTTGAPLLFGYQVLWGQSHDLGFHRAPWGVAHTPVRGLELLNLYLLRLQTYLFEASIPSLAPAVGTLLLVRGIDRFDRYLFTSGALLLGLYFAYWHDGFLFGPRFIYPLLPIAALWTARLPRVVRARFGEGLAYRATWYGYALAAALALLVSIPARAREYAGSFVPMRLDYTGVAARRGVERAIILVRESWGTQLMARLWALGVPRSETELLYARVDACRLEHAITRLEQTGVRDTAAFRALVPLLADSARTIRSTLSADATERHTPGAVYDAVCLTRLAEDRAGFTLLAPLLARDWGTNLYARDMHARDQALVAQYPDRPVYLLRPRSNDTGAPLELFALPPDSLARAWQGGGVVNR